MTKRIRGELKYLFFLLLLLLFLSASILDSIQMTTLSEFKAKYRTGPRYIDEIAD